MVINHAQRPKGTEEGDSWQFLNFDVSSYVAKDPIISNMFASVCFTALEAICLVPHVSDKCSQSILQHVAKKRTLERQR